ncbi:hypothetical protein B7463_g5146, partial [Scytalidium lignicola]
MGVFLASSDDCAAQKDGLHVYDVSMMDDLANEAHVCQSLTLVDDASNCFRQIILPLSLSYGCVKELLLAVGALYLSLDKPTAPLDYYSLALHHKQRALHQLRRHLTLLDISSSDHILASMLMLCLLDITDGCQTSWSTHVSAAASLIGMGSYLSIEPSLLSFVSRFFATRDVMGRSACGNRSKFQEIAWENPQNVDKTVGCSFELLSIISSITDVSRQVVENGEADNTELIQRVATLKSQLNNLVQLLPTTDSNPLKEESILAQSSSLIHNAAKIYFYTALHSARPSTYITQTLVMEQMLIISSIPSLKSAHLWSIFVTSLYACNDEQRVFFLEQFDKLELLSATRGSTQAAKSILQTVWKKRDLEADVNEVLDPCASDWLRFVRPMSEGLNLA